MTTDNSRVDDGGPAFPNVCMNDPCHPSSEPGMTLRDWFAGQALVSVAQEYLHRNGFHGETLYPNLAIHAYRVADAMLAARKGGDQ